MVWTAIKLPCASLRLPTFWASSTGKLLSQRCGEIYVRSRTKWLAGTLMTLGVVSSLFIGGRVGGIGAGALLYCWLRVSGLAIPLQNQGEAVADKQTGSGPARTRCRARRANRHFGDCEGGVCVQPGCRPGQWRLGKP